MAEGSGSQLPVVSKDVDGEESKEIIKGEAYQYNINVMLPENLSNYESITISDELDPRLDIKGTSVLIDKEVNDTYKVDIDGLKVSLTSTTEQLSDLSGKEVKLQITATIKENATTGEKIDNIAQVVINDSTVLETNTAVVIPVNSEEKDVIKQNELKEEDGETGNDEGGYSDKDSRDQLVNKNDSSVSSENLDASINQVDISAESISLNEIDSYGSASNGKIYQIDGNDPTVVKGTVTITGIPDTSLNGLAISENEDFLYAARATSLYRISPDGSAQFVDMLAGGATNAVIYKDKYFHSYLNNDDGKYYLGTYDLTTGEKSSKEINGYDPGSGVGGDLVVDSDGYLWFAANQANAQDTYIAQMNPETAEVIRVIPITQADGTPLEGGVRGISFLPSGEMLLNSGPTNTYFTLFILDPVTLSTTYLTSVNDGGLSVDLASQVTPQFDPFPPALESEKQVEIFEKALGNTDVNNPEEGDILTYTIQTRNTLEEYSILKNLVISDTIPEGLEYVTGTLLVDGEAVTDEEDEDKGQVVDNEIVGELGDIIDNDWHTLEFQVTVQQGQAGKTIDNIATVDAANTEPDNPEAAVDIYPRQPVPDACAVPVALINGEFEEPEGPGTYDNSVAGGGYYYADTVPGWETTDVGRTPRGIIQIMDPDRPSTIPPNTPNQENLTSRFAELNADTHSMLYQELPTVPGQTIYWRLDHRSYTGVDTMSVNIGPVTDDPFNTTPEIERISTGTIWETYTGSYTVPAGQTVTRFGFKAISSSSGSVAFGNYIDNVFLGTEPCVIAEKTVSPEGEVFAGQELTYEVTIKNNGGDIAADVVFEDVIPEGTEYVPGSLKIIDGPGAGDLTDEEGDDAGHFDGEKVIIELGDLPNTNNLPDGITVQFKVKALVDDTVSEVINKAQINYENLLTNESKTTESNETITDLTYQDPVLESQKTAEVLEKAEGNTDLEHPEVGDTLFYTIQTRNTVENSLVKNLVISDLIPDGLEYVTGTLTVDGEDVTDEEDDDAGHSVDGEIFGAFGDVTDTEWHSVTFQVVVGEGQAGKDIENIAIVDGDNIDEPDEPSEEVLVYPREPKLDSDKFSSIEEKGEGNTDTEKYQVGDTIKYTIQARNTVRESVVENFVISDVLPEGLTYVEGSLEVSHDGTGTMEDGTLTANFGNVTDVEWRIVTFLATIDSGQSGQTIQNTATVDGDNIDDPDSPENEFKVDPREPKLESEKTSSIAEKLEGNTDTEHPEVGDVLTYTIQTRNTVEDSLIEKLTIRDVLPEGLEYVEGTLTVDGVSVTDEEDDDAGHSVDGEIFGAFGDIIDTEWHKVTFQVVVGEGQAGKDIENIAIVDGDNIDEPDEPSEEVLVYPRIPVLDSDKFSSIEEKGEGNTDTEKYQVGDTIKYTIQARNTVRESVVENFVISDVLPEGLTYVEGSLEVSHDGTGTMEDGTITASFGDITDIEWRIVTFLATIDSGQSGQTINNTATVDGDNIDDPDSPENEFKVDPREPKIESEKTSSIAEKLEGNTDADNPEVGDILTYTIQTRNTVEDSLVENLTIRDILPEGLEYVGESLTVDGVSVTDEEDGDAGHSVNGEIFGSFGDITDTEWHTVTFQVVVGEGQAGKDIENIATVDGDNIDEPDEPSEEVLVYPREPKLDSDKISSIEEKGEGNTDTEKYQVGDTIKYTIQARNTVRESVMENFMISDVLPEGLTYVEGSLEVSHDGTGTMEDGTLTTNFGDVTDVEWRIVTFLATIDSGQSGQTINNTATVDGDNIDDPDSPENEFKVDPRKPKLESEKTSSIAEKLEGNTDADNPEVGDILTYTIQTRNTVEDSLVENLTIRDVLPEGLEYVEGTLTVDGVSVTDEEDDDAGHSVDGEIFGSFGDVTDTEWHSVTFQVVVGEGQAGKDIENIATVDGDNVDDPDKPSEEVLVYPRDPNLESDKFSSIVEKGEGNTDTDKYQVGDTIEYTIQARNMVKESLIENFVISDVLPEGLTYVEGSLEVSHEGVGTYKDGIIMAVFGDVTDTEWRTVTFKAIIDAGQTNQTIKNTATVDGDNIDEPDQPSEEILVNPRDPKLESEKTAKNVEEGKEVYEVGDTVVYTIRARNKVKDSLVENLVISDVLPEGLTYVEGTLKVSHKGIGTYKDGIITASFGDVTDSEWRTVTFHVTVDADQFGNTIKNVATVGADNMENPETPTEEIVIGKEKASPPVKVEDNQPKQPEATKPVQSVNEGKELPKTATNHYNLMLIGFLLLLIGTIIWYWRRRENA
nr:isopeptide-forming domain-containing fimbrial protein [Ornithinibacillus massiliensis]